MREKNLNVIVALQDKVNRLISPALFKTNEQIDDIGIKEIEHEYGCTIS